MGHALKECGIVYPLTVIIMKIGSSQAGNPAPSPWIPAYAGVTVERLP